MEKTTIDRAAIKFNMQRLNSLLKRGNDLLEYWPRLIQTVSPSTEDFHKWAGNPNFIYEKYRELQLQSMTPQVFDNLPTAARCPELDDPPPQFNPLQPTRSGAAGTFYGGPQRSKFKPGRYAQVAKLAGVARNWRDEYPVIVSHHWLEIKGGKLSIPKTAEKKLTTSFTHKFTDQQVQVGNTMEAMIEALQNVLSLTGGKLPITQKGGKAQIDVEAIKRI